MVTGIYTYPWTSSLLSNLFVSRTLFEENKSADAFLHDAWLGKVDDFIPNKTIEQASINLMWDATKNVKTGIEYAWGQRTTFGDEQATQQRINAMVEFSLF